MKHLRWAVAAACLGLLLPAGQAAAQVASLEGDSAVQVASLEAEAVARVASLDRARHAAVVPVSLAIGAGADSAVQDWEEGRFRRPVVRVGQDFTLRAGEVARDVRSVLGDVTLEGHVERDTFVILGSAYVKESAVLDQALVVIGGSATIDPGAQVLGDLVVIGGSLNAPSGFAPGGDFVAIGTPALGNALHAFVPWLTRGLLWGRPIVPDLGWVWIVFGVMLLVYALVNALFDGPVGGSAEAVLERPLSTFFLGLLVLVLSVPILAILAATVVGLVIVPFVLCAMVVAALVGKAGVCRALGRSLAGGRLEGSGLPAFGAFALGALILTVAYMVPILGLVVWAVTTVLAIGAAAVTLRRRLRREQRARRPVTTGQQNLETAGGLRGAPEAAADAAFFSASRTDATPGEPPSPGNVPPPSASEVPPFGTEPPPFTSEPPPPPPRMPVAGAGLFPAATFLDRVAAFALDCLLVALAVQLLDLSRYDGAFPLLLLAYHIAFWTWKGTTLGGVVVGLRVTRTQGQSLRFADALIRGLSGVFSIAALGIGCFWMLQDPARQMWHDKIAGTHVLKVPREMALQEN